MSEPRNQAPAPSPAPVVAGPFYRNPWLWAAILGVAAVTALRPWALRRTRRVPAPPPVISQLPEFRLIDQDGQPFGSAELRGHVWVADFFFTTCQSICPRLNEQMAKLQRRFRKAKLDIRLVSISVDPENDTPAELRKISRRYSQDERRWRFLTGPRHQVADLLERGFRTAMGEKVKQGSLIDIAHTSRFALVDRKGGLRGLYDSDDDGLDEIYHRAQHVLHATR